MRKIRICCQTLTKKRKIISCMLEKSGKGQQWLIEMLHIRPNFNILKEFKNPFGQKNFSKLSTTGCSGNIVFFKVHCNPSLAYISLKEIFKALNAMRLYSHSHWLVFFCTRERWHFREFLGKKTQYLINTLYIYLPPPFS